MILVTGGTGFVGRSIVRELHRQGMHIRVLARHAVSPAAVSLHQDTGCEIMAGSVTDPGSLLSALKDVTTVIHLVGIIFERGRQTFHTVHTQGTKNVIAACQATGVSRLLHMSASGTRPFAVSSYHQTKWEAECAVRSSGLHWTIFRPAVIYGPGNGFCSLLVRQMTSPWRWANAGCIPMIGDGSVLLQPIHVDEVASAFVTSLQSPQSIGTTYELGGPPISYRELLLTLAADEGVTIHPLPIPREFAYFGAGLIEIFSPWKMPTPGHVAMLEENQNANTSLAINHLGVRPLPFADGLARDRITFPRAASSKV